MLRACITVFLFASVVLCGCRQNAVDPTEGHQRIKSATFSFELPDQAADQEWVELEVPFDFNARIGVVVSVELTGRIVSSNGRHACGACDSGGQMRRYSVVKSFWLSIESGGGVYSFRNGGRREGEVIWDSEPVNCLYGCNAVLKGGAGVLLIKYGSNPLDDAFFCAKENETEVEFCSLEPGSVSFPDQLELRVTYHDYYLPPADY